MFPTSDPVPLPPSIIEFSPIPKFFIAAPVEIQANNPVPPTDCSSMKKT